MPTSSSRTLKTASAEALSTSQATATSPPPPPTTHQPVLGALTEWGYQPSDVERLLIGEEPTDDSATDDKGDAAEAEAETAEGGPQPTRPDPPCGVAAEMDEPHALVPRGEARIRVQLCRARRGPGPSLHRGPRRRTIDGLAVEVRDEMP